MKLPYAVSATLVLFSMGSVAQTERTCMIETFTSSTCPPCNGGNVHLEDLLNDAVNDGKFVSLKYQMDWPSNGDPYFTAEGSQRRSYYSVTGVPNTSVDAQLGILTHDLTQGHLDDLYLVDPGAIITAYYQVTGQTVNIQVDVEALVDIPGSVKLHCAIFEYTTDNNVESNGETEFFHVMKKMIPNASGTSWSSCPIGTIEHFDLSYTFNGSYFLPADANDPILHISEHSVEEFGDLGVALWVQRSTSKEVYQATYAINGTASNDEASNNLPFARVYPNPVNETATVAFDLSTSQSVTLDIYNTSGQIIATQTVADAQVGRNKVDLNTSDYSNGLYLVRIKSDGGEITESFSVQH